MRVMKFVGLLEPSVLLSRRAPTPYSASMTYRYRQPLNPKSEDALVDELSGLVDIAMHRDAYRVIRLILSQKRMSAGAFGEVINALGVIADFKKWVTPLELAWQKQSRRFQRETNSAMLSLYGALADWPKAARHAAPRLLQSPSDYLFGVAALVKTGRMKEARRATRKACELTDEFDDSFSVGCLAEAVAIYFAANKEWSSAFDAWSAAPRDQPLARNAVIGRIEIYMADAAHLIETELAALRELPADFESELILPGNTEGLRRDIEQDLLKLQKAFQKLLPPARRAELGMIDTENENQ